MISVRVTGATRVANRLRTAAARAPQRIDSITQSHVNQWRKDLKATPYPPKRPAQTYVRTGKLANSWAVQKRGLAKYDIVNRAPYAQYVVSKGNQAWMHKGRWWTVDQVLGQRSRRQALTKDLTRALVSDLNGS